MTVLDFVSNYEQLTNPELKEKFLSSNLKVKSYLPVTQKIFLAETICNPYFNQGVPMSAYVRFGFASEWENTVLSYL